MQKNTKITSANPIPSERVTRRIGNTNYQVTVHFSAKSKETINDKILRLIRNEAACGKAAGQ